MVEVDRTRANFDTIVRKRGQAPQTEPVPFFGKLVNFKPAKFPMKIGTWPTWPTFIDVLVGLENSTAPCGLLDSKFIPLVGFWRNELKSHDFVPSVHSRGKTDVPAVKRL